MSWWIGSRAVRASASVDHNAFNWTSLIINTPTQQAPYTGDRARCAASTAPNTRGGTRESTAACGRRPGPQRSCRCSTSGDRHCETGSRGTNRPRVRLAAPPQPPLGCAAFCYRSADCIPNKDCMRTWFEGGATTVKKVGVHNLLHQQTHRASPTSCS